MNIHLRLARKTIPALLALAILPGCMTYQDARTRQEVQEREDIMLLREDIRRLAGRLEGVELEVDRMARDLNQQRSEQSRLAQTAAQDTGTRIGDLERRIAEVDRARENDKKEIVDRLSTSIEQMIRSTAASGRSGGGTSRTIAGYGVEHVVGPGQTLSQIASVYGVRAQVIIDANNIANPDRLQVGQKLFIPE